MGLVDIHCHLLYGVDDGAKNIDESIAMLDVAARQDITDIIVTPHLRRGMFSYPPEAIKAAFTALWPEAKKRGIHLYLGCEYHVNEEMSEKLQKKRIVSLGNSEYILTEFKHNADKYYIADNVNQLLSCGYIPVIAHVERIEYLHEHIPFIEEIRRYGAMIQVNADAILGYDGRTAQKFTQKLLDKNLVDIVASDSHGVTKRKNNLGEAYQKVVKKYGKETADRAFSINPRKIIAR